MSSAIFYRWLLFGTLIFSGLALLLALNCPTVLQPSASGSFISRDMTGTVHYFAEPPHRILFTANVMPAFAVLAQGTNRIAAASSLGRAGMKQALLDHIYPNVDAIPSVGTRLDPESVLSIRPDAILGWDRADDAVALLGFKNFIKLRSNSAIKMDLVIWSLLGQLSASEEKAVAIRREAELKYGEWRRSTLDITPKTRTLILVSGIDKLWLGPKHHALNERLALAGATNVVSTLNTAIFDLEEILRSDPQAILISTAFDNLTPSDLYARPEWQAVKAVRRRQVYLLPDFPNFAAPVFDPLLVEWLRELFYPEASHSLRQSIQSTYQNVFGYVCSDADVDRVIQFDANRHSAFYDRFVTN